MLVKAATRLTYVFASNTPRPTARGGVPFKRIGKNTWALGVSFEHAMRHTAWWNIGIRVGTRTPVTDDRLCLASARARGGRAWWPSNESLHATGRLCRTVPMRNLQRQRGSSSAAATHRRPVRPVLRFPVTGPRPAVARSTYMGSSGEHINADIAYIAGYEWALAVANNANCPRARLGSLPRADLASPHRE